MQVNSTTSIISGPKKVTLRSQDIINQNVDVLDFLAGKRSQQAVMRYEHGNLVDLDRGIPTNITRTYTIAAYDDSYPTPKCLKIFTENYIPAITSVEVKYPDRSSQRFTLNNSRLPQIEFFYDVEPLKTGETIVLVGGEDHSNDLIRLKSNSIPSEEKVHRFDIEFKGLIFNNVQIASVYDVVLTDDEINIGIVIDSPFETIEISRGDSVIVTRVR